MPDKRKLEESDAALRGMRKRQKTIKLAATHTEGSAFHVISQIMPRDVLGPRRSERQRLYRAKLTKSPPSGFLDLPGELRNKIYNYLIPTKDYIDIRMTRHFICRNARSLFHVNRQVRKETQSIYLASNKFYIPHHDPWILNRSLRLLRLLDGYHPNNLHEAEVRIDGLWVTLSTRLDIQSGFVFDMKNFAPVPHIKDFRRSFDVGLPAWFFISSGSDGSENLATELQALIDEVNALPKEQGFGVQFVARLVRLLVEDRAWSDDGSVRTDTSVMRRSLS